MAWLICGIWCFVIAILAFITFSRAYLYVFCQTHVSSVLLTIIISFPQIKNYFAHFSVHIVNLLQLDYFSFGPVPSISFFLAAALFFPEMVAVFLVLLTPQIDIIGEGTYRLVLNGISIYDL